MVTNKPLSISGYQTYVECPRKFKLHYFDRIRPITQPSYFIFGSAVDKALNALLLEQGVPLAECETELKRLVVEQVEFLPTDYDGELIDDKTKAVLLEKCREFGYQGDNVDALASTLLAKPFAELSDNQRKALALCCAASLKEKARLMIEAYRREVLPRIKRVGEVQKEIRWKDDLGNEFVGVLDLPCELPGWGDVVADNKTSGNPARDYGPDSVRSSMQLAIYSKVTGKTHAAFFVLDKNMKKNRIRTCKECGNVATGRHKSCDAEIEVPDENGDYFGTTMRCGGEWSDTIQPECKVTVVIDEIPAQEQELVQSALTGVAESIKRGCFPHNLKSCEQKYGPKRVKCAYHSFCRTGEMAGLEKKAGNQR